MTDFADYCLKVVSKFLKRDVLYQDFFHAVNFSLQELETEMNELKRNFFFNTMTADAVLFMETLLKITPINSQTLDNRRDAIRAKWRSSGHNCIKLIQNVCESWQNGEAEANFINGKIHIKFLNAIGVPDNLSALVNAINTVKPAHLAYYLIFRFLKKKEIHGILTKKEMQLYKKNQYMGA